MVAQGVSTETGAPIKTPLQNLSVKQDQAAEQHLGEKNLLTFRTVTNIRKANQVKDFSLQECHFPFSHVITFYESEKSDLLTHVK